MVASLAPSQPRTIAIKANTRYLQAIERCDLNNIKIPYKFMKRYLTVK